MKTTRVPYYQRQQQTYVISTKGAGRQSTQTFTAHEEDNTKFFEEARAFRTEAVAGRGQEEKLVERFGKTATAIRIQVVERRMIAVVHDNVR